VRLAGELVFRRLERVVAEKLETTVTAELAPLAAEVDAAEVLAARELFRSIDTDGSETLDREELLRSGLLRSLGECEDCSCRGVDTCASVDRFMRQVGRDGEIDFVDFLLKATRALYTPRDWDDLLAALRPASPDARKFDAMCAEFTAWSHARQAYDDTAAPTSPPSRLDLVLDGCFAGLANKHLLAALRTVFEDYHALRLCADLIFRLMRATAQRAPWFDSEPPQPEPLHAIPADARDTCVASR